MSILIKLSVSCYSKVRELPSKSSQNFNLLNLYVLQISKKKRIDVFKPYMKTTQFSYKFDRVKSVF